VLVLLAEEERRADGIGGCVCGLADAAAGWATCAQWPKLETGGARWRHWGRRLGLALLASGHRVSYELDRLLQCNWRVPTGVTNLNSERYVWKDAWIGIDGVDGLEGCLDALNSVLLAHCAAGASLRLLWRRPLVNRNQDSNHQVAGQGGHSVSVWNLHKAGPFGGQEREQEQE